MLEKRKTTVVDGLSGEPIQKELGTVLQLWIPSADPEMLLAVPLPPSGIPASAPPAPLSGAVEAEPHPARRVRPIAKNKKVRARMRDPINQ
jgi:hypothetical protein